VSPATHGDPEISLDVYPPPPPIRPPNISPHGYIITRFVRFCKLAPDIHRGLPFPDPLICLPLEKPAGAHG